MKPLIRLPKTAANEVSDDEFVTACVAFQHAKGILSVYLNGADAQTADLVSLAVYKLANKAVARNVRTTPQKNEARQPLHACIAQAMRGRKKFNIQDAMDALTRRNQLPKVANVRSTISNALGLHKSVFQRVTTGVYKVKERKLVFDKKTPKQLPASTG